MTANQKIRTTPKFWDCACEHAYFHHHTVPCCARCGACRDEQPDSREDEVEAHLVDVMDEILKRCGDALSDLQQMCVGQHAPEDLRFPVVLFLRPAHLDFHLQKHPTAEQLVRAAELVRRNGQLRAAFQTAVRHAAAELLAWRTAEEVGDG